MMKPLDHVGESLEHRLSGTEALTGIEIAALLPVILDMFVTLISTCRGSKSQQVDALKENTTLRRIAARRIVRKSLKESKIKASRADKEALVDALLLELTETTSEDVGEVLDEIKTIDWGSL